MIKLCTYLTLFYAVVINLQSVVYYRIFFCLPIIRFEATQQNNKRSWIASDQIMDFQIFATKS